MNEETLDVRIISLDVFRGATKGSKSGAGRRFTIEVNGSELTGIVIFCGHPATSLADISKMWYTFLFDNPLVKKAKNYKLLRYSILKEMLGQNVHMNSTTLRRPK